MPANGEVRGASRLAGEASASTVLTCALGHKPRFFKPRFIHDYNWGWKRNCADYEQKGN